MGPAVAPTSRSLGNMGGKEGVVGKWGGGCRGWKKGEDNMP